MKQENLNRTETLSLSAGLYEIECPFCQQRVYSEAKDYLNIPVSQFSNCIHIYIQYHQGRDKTFLIREKLRNQLKEWFTGFLEDKGIEFTNSLLQNKGTKNYTLDDFMMDIYVHEKITVEDERILYMMLPLFVYNYEIRIRCCVINKHIIVHYFMMEK